MTTRDLRYPIGTHDATVPVTAEQVAAAAEDVRALPERLAAAVEGLTDEQLDTPYRPGGWTVRQLVHHVADSHVNAYVRLRLALTEDAPVIRPYEEKGWAELPDATTLPPAASLDLLRPLHHRWSTLLDALTPKQMERPWRHPDMPGATLTVGQLVVMYGWHSRHHVAHVMALREREGW